ncbi:unnamed protein product [Miscanthus lutarioriparius]|uniref:Uncharacterized protein n=1 Tax=Miscanthus lutarioriparius TaxID=422564 RepID=A0A811MZM7_9POAL|nr:unnamed protein product [Miscanthus lutarioriparius]
MRSLTLAVAAAVLVLAVLASGGVVVVGAAARPVVRQGGGSAGAGAVLHLAVVAVELTSTNSSAQPSNCTYGNNPGGVCPPTPPAPGVGH